MTAYLHVNNATTVKIVRMRGYNPAPNQTVPIFQQKLRFAVTTGPLPLKHTGPGNTWKGKSTNRKLVAAVMAYKNLITVRACNTVGCTTSTLTAFTA
jgi:hypothetical protein